MKLPTGAKKAARFAGAALLAFTIPAVAPAVALGQEQQDHAEVRTDRYWLGGGIDIVGFGGEWRFSSDPSTTRSLASIAPRGLVRTDGTFDDKPPAGAEVTSAVLKRRGTGYQMYGGYWFHPLVGLEGFYARVNDMALDVRVSGTISGEEINQTLRYQDDFQNWGLAVIARSPPTRHGVRLFARMGLHQWKFTNGLTGFAVEVAEVKESTDAYRPRIGTKLAHTFDNSLTTRGNQVVSDIYYGVGVEWELPLSITLRGEHEVYEANDLLPKARRRVNRVGLYVRF